MKIKNIFRIIWVVGIYAILVLILYLVVIYKVKWEDLDLNTYLYFYECSNNLCTSNQKPEDNYYSKIMCHKNKCPYITEKNDNQVVLNDGSKEYIYDYINETIVNNKYNTYKVTNNKLSYIVSDKNNNYGVIDLEGNIIIELNDTNITDYKGDFYTYKKDKLYGLINKNGNNIVAEPTYKDIILINNEMYAYKDDGQYYIASYDTLEPLNNNKYDYIISINDIIITFNNKQINILDNHLQSKLLIPINTYYAYKTEKERDTLKIEVKDNYISFSVYINDSTHKNYIYDTNNNKLYN